MHAERALRSQAAGSIGNVDVILTSPECTNYTYAKMGSPGTRTAEDPPYVLPCARQLRPRWIVLENVIQMRSWSGYDLLIDELNGLGYSDILSAHRSRMPPPSVCPRHGGDCSCCATVNACPTL
jgi:site-specific DNA-cytosine methylase